MRVSRVTAILTVLIASVPALATAQFAPDPPRGLTATVTGSDVTLSWQAAFGAPGGYLIDAGSAPGLTDLGRLSTNGPATSLSVANVPTGNYFVRVRAINAAGTSEPSPDTVVTVGTPCALPVAPSGLNATVTGASVTLSWTATDGVLLVAGSAPGRSDILSTNLGTAPGITATASPGTYYVRVHGTNACGVGLASSEVVVPVLVPDAPSNLRSSVIGSQLTVTWDAPATGTTPLGYVLEAGASSGSTFTRVPLGASPTRFVAPNVPSGTYYLRLRATSGPGLGPASNELQVTIGPGPGGLPTVTFNALAPNGPSFTTHTEVGFTVDAIAGPWRSGPQLVSVNPSRLVPLDSELRVTSATGGVFRLLSARLYSSVTPIPYVIRGVANGHTVYTATGTVPNTFGNYATVANPYAGMTVDTVFITVTNPAIPTCPTCGGNPVGIDDIVLRTP